MPRGADSGGCRTDTATAQHWRLVTGSSGSIALVCNLCHLPIFPNVWQAERDALQLRVAELEAACEDLKRQLEVRHSKLSVAEATLGEMLARRSAALEEA